MTRTRASAKAAGATFERQHADHLALHIDDRIDRRVKTGAKDKGDIAGIRLARAIGGGRVVGEAKNYGGEFHVGTWLGEAELERVNDGAIATYVVAKRRGVTAPGLQVVFMTVDDLVAILSGVRPE